MDIFFVFIFKSSTSHFPATYLLGFHSGLCSTHPMCLMNPWRLVPKPNMLKLLVSWSRWDPPFILTAGIREYLLSLMTKPGWKWRGASFASKRIWVLECYHWNKSFPLSRTIHIDLPRYYWGGRQERMQRQYERVGFRVSGNLESYITVSHRI